LAFGFWFFGGLRWIFWALDCMVWEAALQSKKIFFLKKVKFAGA
jgi:hypothetical protein